MSDSPTTRAIQRKAFKHGAQFGLGWDHLSTPDLDEAAHREYPDPPTYRETAAHRDHLMTEPKHPIQPVILDNSVARFKANKIVRFLLNAGFTDMNKLACMEFSDDDRTQFAQLIGYSVSGAGDLSYFDESILKEADRAVERMMGRTEEDRPDDWFEQLEKRCADSPLPASVRDEPLTEHYAKAHKYASFHSLRLRKQAEDCLDQLDKVRDDATVRRLNACVRGTFDEYEMDAYRTDLAMEEIKMAREDKSDLLAATCLQILRGVYEGQVSDDRFERVVNGLLQAFPKLSTPVPREDS